MPVDRLSMMTMTLSTRYIISRLIGISLGALLMTAGVVKGLDLHAFAIQIHQYGLLPENMRIANSLALSVVSIEIALGAALMVNWQPKTSLLGVMSLLIIFIVALIWAMIKGGVDDCGCFGPAAVRSPAQALIEDCVLLLATITTWHLNDRIIYYRHTVKGYVAALAFVMGLALPLVNGPFPFTRPVPAATSTDIPQSLVLQSPSGTVINIKSRATLLALMSTDCHHCRESVPSLNDIVETVGNSIQVYGVAANGKTEIDRFIEENFVFYPVLPIDEMSLNTLLGDDSFPKLVLFNQGRIVAQWSDQIPTSEELIELTKAIKGA